MQTHKPILNNLAVDQRRCIKGMRKGILLFLVPVIQTGAQILTERPAQIKYISPRVEVFFISQVPKTTS